MVTFYPEAREPSGIYPLSLPEAPPSILLCSWQSGDPSISNDLQASCLDCPICSTRMTLSSAFLSRDSPIFQRNPLMPFLRKLS